MTEPPSAPASTDAATQPLMFCLDGKPAPADLGPALLRLLELPEQARSRLEELLLPNLQPLSEDQLDNRIGRLCRRQDLPADVVGPGIKAVVFVFQQAAVFDVGSDELRQDLTALGAGQDLVDVLLGLYDKAFDELRAAIATATIAAHGKVLAGVEWRIDTLGSSNRGRRLNMPVALVTFHYQDGDQTDRITLQMLPQAVQGLRELCDQLLSG